MMSCKYLVSSYNHDLFHIDFSFVLVSCCLRKEPNKIYIYNPGQNIWQKVKRYNKIGQGFKNIISNFACLLTAIVHV